MRAITAQDEELLERARHAAEAAYCPYSRFPVGAAAEADNGVFSGCNIENASYSLGVCAERVSIQSAVAAGSLRVLRLAVSCTAAQVSGPVAGRMPCGACRQVIAEFMAGDAEVIIDGAGVWRVDELLPEPFRLAGTLSARPPSD
jgi:cytidine deaminase